MINWFKNWKIIRVDDYEELCSDYGVLEAENDIQYKMIQQLNTRNTELSSQIQRYKCKRPSVHNAKEWDNRWKQNKVYYSAPKRKQVIEYVRYRHSEIIDGIAVILIRTNALRSDDCDGVPIAVLKWLIKKFKSRTFKYKTEKKETWLDPEELLSKKEGDCDDWGILEYFLIRAIFMKLNCWDKVKHRLKCVAGNVNNFGSIPSSAGGHFYLVWLRGDKEWYGVESTYGRERSLRDYGVKPLKFNSAYGVIWFSFTEYTSWSNHSLTVSKNDWKKNT
jgi:hypothetical protein